MAGLPLLTQVTTGARVQIIRPGSHRHVENRHVEIGIGSGRESCSGEYGGLVPHY